MAAELTKWSTKLHFRNVTEHREAVFWRTIRTTVLALPSVLH